MSDNNPPVDGVVVEDEASTKPVEKNLKSRSTWLRLLFMAAYCLIVSVAGMVGSIVVLLGFLWVLFTGEVNRQLQQAGQGLAAYFFEIIRYLTYNTEDKPFPFGGEWPSAEQEKG